MKKKRRKGIRTLDFMSDKASEKAMVFTLREEMLEQEEAMKHAYSHYFILENYVVSEMDNNDTDEKISALSYHIENLYNDIQSTGKNTLDSTTPVEFKVHIDSPEVYSLSAGHFILHLILWNPIFRLGQLPRIPEDILQPKTFNNNVYENFMNGIIDRYKHLTDIKTMSRYFAETFDYIREILLDMEMEGYSFSLYDMVMAMKRNPEIRQIMNTEIDLENHKFAETEDYIKDQTDRLLQLFEEDPGDNCIKPMAKAGEGLNKKQTREFAVHIGMKPDLSGKTIPLTDNTNLIKGLRTPESLFVDAKGGRKAVLLQKKVGDSGYLQRMFSKATASIQLNHDEEYDCGTKNFIKVKFEKKYDDDTKKVIKRLLKQLKGCVIRINDPKSKEEFVLEGAKDYKSLKGKTIYVRTPATCASKTDQICLRCYGERYYMNSDIHIGINTALNILRNITQKSLSAKHILNTTSSKIKFNDEFKKFMKLTDGYIINFKKKVVVEDLKLLIPSIGIFDRDEVEEAYNESFDHFIVESGGKKYKIADKNEIPFYLSEELYKLYKNNRKNQSDERKYVKINGKQLVDMEILMFVQLINDEITRPLKKLRSMIEKGSVIEDMTYQELIFRFNEYLLDAGIFATISDIAILVRKIIKAPNSYEVPDWGSKNADYYLTSINNSIKTNSSVIDGLTFEYFRRQMRSPMTFQKTGTSIYDPFFFNWNDLDMEPYERAIEEMKG